MNRKTPLKKRSKKMTELKKSQDIAKKELLKLLPQCCELEFDKCMGEKFLTLAHRHSRWAYKRHPKMLWHYNQVITACVKCHELLDENKAYKELHFKDLRGEDLLCL